MSAEGVEGDKDKKSSVAGENSSPSNVVKLKRAVPSPRNSDALWGGWQTPRGATPIGVNYGSNDVSEGGSSGSGSDGGGSGGGVFDAAQDVVTANTVYFTDSSTSKRSSNGGAGEGKLRRGGDGAGNTEDESIPLLAKDVASSAGGDDLESTADFQFGVLMEDSGLWYRDISGKHLIRFIVLLLLLLFSSLVGILIVLWKILTKEISGIFIAINVLDTITNFGQGVFLLILFGLEKHWFWMKLYSKLRGLLFKIETVIIPPKDELDPTILNQCSVFKAMHMDQCKEDILSDRRYIFWSYTSVFTGSGLVDWLMHQGIVSSREEAVEYGHTLMLGQVLAHVSEEHYFHDSGHFYQFL